MKILACFLIFLTVSSKADLDKKFKWKFTQRQDSSCEESNQNCKECIQQKSCSWCGVDAGRTSSCIPSVLCPSSLQHSSCPDQNNLESQLESLENQVILDSVPQVTLSASYLCNLRRNCTSCTRLGFCAWCNTKNTCVPYFGSNTTNLCGSESWSRDQCVSNTGAQHAKPCPQRSSGCKECLADERCYWCDAPKSCRYYQGSGVKPANCTSGNWYYKDCSKPKAVIVLLPILVIMATPIMAYLAMYCVMCVMKEAGYNNINDSETSDDEDKIRKPIMLRHSSPGSKTDDLRKKYGLGKKP